MIIKKAKEKNLNQLILISDHLPKRIRNRKSLFSENLELDLHSAKILYTSLLPGPELEAAALAYKKRIPYVAVIPYKNYPANWPVPRKQRYDFYLKKALKVFYVDRQLNFISEISEPDIYGKEKIFLYIDWLFKQINLSPIKTNLITYVEGFHSFKMKKLARTIASLDPEQKNKFKLTQRTFFNDSNLYWKDRVF